MTHQPARPKISDELQTWLDNLAKDRHRPVLCIVGEMNDKIADDVRLYYWSSLTKFDRLSVLLHSYGGYAKPAYRMIATLRRSAKDIEVLVPQEAKSAATLFCIGANKIYMGYRSELGPLDTQLRDRSGNYQSALESFKASEQLLEHAILALKRIIQETAQSNQDPTPMWLRRQHVQRQNAQRRQTNSLMNSIVSNLYEEFDSNELGRHSRYLAEMEEYAVRAMHRSGNWKDGKEMGIRRAARKLVWEYPSHDFFIDLQEAKEIGLDAEFLDEVEWIKYDIRLAGILEDTEADDLGELMDGDVDTFFGIGFPDTETNQGEPDNNELGSEGNTDADDDSEATDLVN